MAKFVIRNGFVSIGGNDVSSLIREVTVEMAYDDVDVTSMGAGAHQRLAGLRSDTFTMTAFSDFDSAAGLDRLIWPIFAAAPGTTVIAVAANTSSIGSGNPYYIGTCSLLTYNPISGAVGDASTTPLTWVATSGTFNRATS